MKTYATVRRPAARHRRDARHAQPAIGGWASRLPIRRLLHRPRLQPKLTVGPPGDAFEREADRTADAVMRMPDRAVPAMEGAAGAPPGLQRVCAECEEEMRRQPLNEPEDEEVRAQRAAGAGVVPRVGPDLADRIQALRGGGRPLPESARSFFEPRFGHDFGDVRVHADGRSAELARAVQARAFTVGRDVVFGAGEYAPGSEGGRRLLAHELTHVVQQAGGGTPTAQALASPTGGPLIQRALNCAIDHVTKECDGAAASCLTVQDDYCKKKYPKAADLDTLHTNAVTGADSKKSKLPNAAANLLHYLGASGSEKVMPVDLFKNHSATQDQLKDVHREKFIEGAEKRLKDGRLTVGGTAEMVWTDTANAFDFTENDLGLSVGGYTLCSEVKVSAKATGGGDVEVSFDSWTVEAFDCYNWDPGKGIGGLFGGVTDKDLCCLQNAGKGKHFRIRTDPWTNTHAAGSFTIAAAPKPKPKPPPKPKKDDR